MRYFYYKSVEYKTELDDNKLNVIIRNSKTRQKKHKQKREFNAILNQLVCNAAVFRLIFEYANFETARFIYEPIYIRKGEEELNIGIGSVLSQKKSCKHFFLIWTKMYNDIKKDKKNNDYSKFGNESYEELVKFPIEKIHFYSYELYCLSAKVLLKQLETECYLKIDDDNIITDTTSLNCIHAALLSRVGRFDKRKVIYQKQYK